MTSKTASKPKSRTTYEFAKIIFPSIICLIFTTFIIFTWLQRDLTERAIATKKAGADSNGVAQAPQMSPPKKQARFSEMPSYAVSLDAVEIVRQRFQAKMNNLALCQSQGNCPRHVLLATTCHQFPCGDVAGRFMGLVSAFYLAYVTDRVFYVSWTESDFNGLFDINDSLYAQVLPQEECKKLTEDAVQFSSVWPTTQEWIEIDSINFENHSLVFVEQFLSMPMYGPVIEELFSVKGEKGDRNMLMPINIENLVAVALRVLFKNPTPQFKNLVADMWQNMYDAVDPPRGRELLPGRFVGNDGITRFGVFAYFDNTKALNQLERMEAMCFCEGVVNLAVYYGQLNGVAGVFVASDSSEARKIIAGCLAKRGLPAISLDTEQMNRALGIQATHFNLNYVNGIRTMVEWTLFTLMDVLVYRQSLLGDLATMAALRSNVPAHYLPFLKLPLKKNVDDMCEFKTVSAPHP